MGVALGQPCPACGSVHCTAVQKRAEAAEDRIRELEEALKRAETDLGAS